MYPPLVTWEVIRHCPSMCCVQGSVKSFLNLTIELFCATEFNLSRVECKLPGYNGFLFVLAAIFSAALLSERKHTACTLRNSPESWSCRDLNGGTLMQLLTFFFRYYQSCVLFKNVSETGFCLCPRGKALVIG
jgi:hypothetical protein